MCCVAPRAHRCPLLALTPPPASAAPCACAPPHPHTTTKGGAAASSRSLEAVTLPTLALPALSEFLPPADMVKMMPLSDFLTKAGLPQWDELGLPPLSELLKPVGGPEGAKLPSMAQISNEANTVFQQVLATSLPPELQSLTKVAGAPKINVTAAAKALNATAVTALINSLGLPGVNSASLAALQSVVQADWNNPIAIPSLPAGVMPSYTDIYKAAATTYRVANALNKIKSQTTLQRTKTVIGWLGSLAKLNLVKGAASGTTG
jgi:hypothetical protein